MPTVSVIVPAWNAQATLGACLDALAALSPPAFEVIVVDDGSSDGTASLAESRGVRLVRRVSNEGPGAARNAGAAVARGDILAFTDADCVVPGDWLAGHLAALAREEGIGSTGPYAGTTHDGVLETLMDVTLRLGQRSMPETIESCISSNLVVRAEDFRAVGGFPVYRLPGAAKPCWTNEDEELAYRLVRRFGRALAWVPASGVLHAYRGTLARYGDQQFRYAESILVSYARFPGMMRGRTNYSRSSGGLHVLAALAVVAAPALAFFHPAGWLAAVPFLVLVVPEASGVLAATRRHRCRGRLAAAVVPFLLLRNLAWAAGLASGTVKAIRGAWAWRKESRD